MPEIGSLANTRKMLKEMKEKYRFKKANDSREAAAKLQYDLVVCRGQLELSKKDLARVIRTQCRNIEDGDRRHIDTSIQEEMLKDAVVGYMLVRDALFQMTTIANSDSISYAYENLDRAVNLMSGKGNGGFKWPWSRALSNRGMYQDITSPEAKDQKREYAEQIIPRLKRGEDIEACLEQLEWPGDTEARRQEVYMDDGRVTSPRGGIANDNWNELLRNAKDSEDQGGSDAWDIDDVDSPALPKATEIGTGKTGPED